MGRLSNSDERRDQIVAAFMKIVSKKGYSGASIQEIATEADLTPGLIHYHFKSKQEILMTLFLRLEDLVRERLELRIAKLTSDSLPEAKLYALIDAFLELDLKSDELAVSCWTVISAEAIINPELKRTYRQAVERQLEEIEVAVKVAVSSKKIRKEKISEIASAVLAAIHGNFLLASTAPGLIPKGSAAASVKSMAKGIIESVRSS